MRTLRTIVLAAFCIAAFEKSNAQDAFKFRYILKSSVNDKGKLVEEIKGPGKEKVYKGFVETGYNEQKRRVDSLPIYTWEDDVTYANRSINKNTKIKVGKITINEDHDSLKMLPWYNDKITGVKIHDVDNGGDIVLDSDNDFYLAIDWDKPENITRVGKYPILKMPFKYHQVAVTSLPFRVGLHDGEFKADFLNANIGYMWIWGKTKFFKSKFLDPKSNYWGFGPFVGASTIENENDKDIEYFGFNYGVNVVRSISNINLTLALGAETSFKTKATSFIPYVGLGLGIKIIELYEPENTED